ncbi:MAG: UbiD family decarboxylase, partial [Deltaproteobacteria bacterium]
MHPLVRWQYRGGIPEEGRKGFLFENVIDCKGMRYPGQSVAVGVHAASKYVYAIGLGCKPEEINAKWEYAIANSVEPVIISDGPVHEEIHMGKELEVEGGGLDRFPIPISTPGFDNGPYSTCSCWTTKDPDTGVQNVGNYRGQIKARNRVGVFLSGLGQDMLVHLEKCREKGIPLEAALVVGAPPVVAFTAVTKIPRGVDEVAVAGGLAGAPIQMVKCQTVDIAVPAEAEIVIEGIVPTDVAELEGPFGESHGHMNPRQISPFLEVRAITYRKNPVWSSWISQATPSESSCIKRDAYEAVFYNYLRHECRIGSLTKVVMHEPLTNLRKVIVLQFKNPSPDDAWRALHAAISRDPGVGKIVVAVDQDIDPNNWDAILWAMSYRMNPQEDVAIVGNRRIGHGPPFRQVPAPVGGDQTPFDSAMLINALLKEPFPPVSLPKREYMERAKQIWEELGLPKLKPETPWFGYSLGQWTEENEEEAELALRGEHYKTGEKVAKNKVKM